MTTLTKLINSITTRMRLVSVGTYGVANALPRFTNAILAILYASVFTLGQFGQYGILAVSVGLFGLLLDLGVPQALLRNYYDLHHDQDLAREYLSTAIFSTRIVSFVFLPFLGVVLYFCWPLLHIHTTHVLHYVVLILAVAYFERTSVVLSTAFRALEKPLLYAVGPLAQAVVTSIAGVVLVLVMHKGIAGALLVMLVGRMASWLSYECLLRFHLRIYGGRVDWKVIRSCLSFGLPLVPNRIAVWFREASLRPILVNFISLSSVGIFSLASSVASFPLLVSSSVEFVLSPYYFKQRATAAEGFTHRAKNFGEVFSVGLAVLWAGLVLFCPEIIRTFVGHRYAGAVPICTTLLCASFVRAQQQFIVRQIHFLKETWIIPILTVPSAAISVGLAILFSVQFDVAFVGWAVLIADLALYVALVVWIRTYEHIHHPIFLTLKLTAVLLFLAVWVSWGPPVFTGWSNVASKVAILAVISAFCFVVWIWPNRAFIRSIARS